MQILLIFLYFPEISFLYKVTKAIYFSHIWDTMLTPWLCAHFMYYPLNDSLMFASNSMYSLWTILICLQKVPCKLVSILPSHFVFGRTMSVYVGTIVLHHKICWTQNRLDINLWLCKRRLTKKSTLVVRITRHVLKKKTKKSPLAFLVETYRLW